MANFFDQESAPIPVPLAPWAAPPPSRRPYAIAALHGSIRRVASGRQPLSRASWSLTRFLADGALTESEIRDCMVAAARAANIPIREACLTIDSAIRSKRGR